MRTTKKGLRWTGYFFLFAIASTLTGSVIREMEVPVQRKPASTSDQDWASESYGYAPHPGDYKDGIIQVYGARTRGIKKVLAVHTWIATKKKGADHYVISQIFGWRLKRNGTALNQKPGIPDTDWAGNEPMLILDVRGMEAEKLLDKIDTAIQDYPWKDTYTVWPGPNSNTFIAWIGLEVPELQMDLPSTAIGKDWRPISETFGKSVSGTGVQASLYGLLGVTAAFEEGLEINILGLSIELDLFDKAVELPGIGRIGD